MDSDNDKFKEILMAYMVNTDAKIKKKVCNVSVHTMVLIPDLLVYNQTSNNIMITVTENGILNLSKNANCNIFAASNSLSAAPKD